jgi:hypothetical protein
MEYYKMCSQHWLLIDTVIAAVLHPDLSRPVKRQFFIAALHFDYWVVFRPFPLRPLHVALWLPLIRSDDYIKTLVPQNWHFNLVLRRCFPSTLSVTGPPLMIEIACDQGDTFQQRILAAMQRTFV